MKSALLITLAISSFSNIAFGFGGSGVSEGPAILMPTSDQISAFANERLSPQCARIDVSQVEWVGPVNPDSNLAGFIYSFSTDCDGVRRDFKIITSGGLAPQPEKLILVR